VSRRSISHAGTCRSAPVTFLNSRLKRGEILSGEAKPFRERGIQGNGFYLLAGRYYRVELFFIPGESVGKNEGEQRRNRPRLALISSVAISLAPHFLVPRENGGENEEGLYFAIFLLFLSLSLPSPPSLSLSQDTNLCLTKED